MKQKKLKYNILCCIVSLMLLITGAAANGADDFAIGAANSYADTEVYVGGMPFGVRFQAGEVTVVRTNTFLSEGTTVSPAQDAGILANDIISKVNGKKVTSIEDVVQLVGNFDGTPMALTIKRDGKEFNVRLSPKACDESHAFRLGVMLKDSSAGIGTVTFLHKDGLTFGGLGHGICDASGEVIRIESGYISNVKINGINKGKVGVPGELCGSLEQEKCGKLLSNSEVGVYGVFTIPPKLTDSPIQIAAFEEVEVGKASIFCTLDDNQRKEYTIEIEEINHDETAKTKNYIIRVTDPCLLDKTGGIVQGMSGSPIVQNGKLVGAVTHVLVNDPTKGYGIFIENMLDAAA